MPLPEDRLQQIILSKDAEAAQKSCDEHGCSECWAIVDGALVIYDDTAMPNWLGAILRSRDEDGNTPQPHEMTPAH